MTDDNRVAVLIMAAGAGVRYGGERPKQYQPLAGRAAIAHAVAAFRAHPAAGDVRCVIDPAAEDLFAAAFDGAARPQTIIGGATRQASVRNGLEALAALPRPPDLVLIHDAARPMAPGGVIDGVLDALAVVDAAAPALAIPDTVSRVDGDAFAEDVDRTRLVRRQTPQGFRFGPILAAHRAHADQAATDDIALARRAGLSTASTPGSVSLHKLTSPDDKRILEAMLNSTTTASVGNGFDVHAFGPGDRLVLCGVDIPFDRGLVGHSDADVAMHALTDAMLGAVGAGDIGLLFPPSDPQWKGAASHIFLTRALEEIGRADAALESVDVTIICEAPKVGPHRDRMRDTLAGHLRIDRNRVNVKATTTEGLGFPGRGEGVAAMATATVSRCR